MTRSSPSKPFVATRSCQRHTQVLDLPVCRMMSTVPTLSAPNRMISARQNNMTKIALTAAAILIGMGTAFAGSDNYGSNNVNRPAACIDNSYTASVMSPTYLSRSP